MGFNPRPRAGGDRGRRRGDRGVGVSIRAPARGATRKERLFIDTYMFQSAPPRGGRPARRALNAGDGRTRNEFQSAPPRGGRHRCRLWRLTLGPPTFQSAPPRGGRPVRGLAHAVAFQSAPPRGDPGRLSACFNPRPRAGGDPPGAEDGVDGATRFNPRPRAGGDPMRRGGPGRRMGFQSAPPRGGRPGPPLTHPASPPFQSAPPRGGRPTSAQLIGRGWLSFNPRPRAGGDRL